LAGLALSFTMAHAAPVTVNNHDFETGTSYPTVQDWASDNNSGINSATPFGNALWINGTGVVSQTTTEAIVEGVTYTLTVDIGQQSNWAGGGAVIRLYGSDDGPGVPLAEFDSGSLPASGDSLLNQTASFVATAGQDTGQTVGIALIGGGGVQVRLDNVRLDAGAGDSIAPALNTKVPDNGASHVEVGSNLVATFSEDVAKGTGNIVIKRYDDDTDVETIDVTTGNVTISGADVTINPVSDLPDDTQVYVEIAGGAIEDLAGNDFAGISGNADWSFTTDATAPSLTTLSPGNGDTGVSSATNLVITFNEDVQEGSGNLVIKESGGTPFETIPFGVSDARISISGAAVTIDPTGVLALSTGYYVEIDSGAIKDLANNDYTGFTGNATWAFTTGDGLGPITLQNPSFEDGTWGTSTATHDAANPVGWSSNAGANFQPRGSISTLTPTDGFSQAWMNGGKYAYQDSGEVIVEGRTYTLQVDIGNSPPFDNIETMTIRLYGSDAGVGTALAEITPSVGAPGTWTLDQTVSFVATAGQATGQTLGVYLGVTSGTQAEWDNVRLEASVGGGSNDFTDWIADFPGVGGETGFDDDPDKDGNGNGLENYFGTDPSAFSEGVVSGDLTGSVFAFTHPLNDTPADDVTAVYEWSTTLGGFNADGATDGGTTVTFAQGAPVDGIVTVTATITGTLPDKLFVRVSATN